MADCVSGLQRDLIHRTEKIAAVHFTTIPSEPDTANRRIESHIFTKFVPVETTLCINECEYMKYIFELDSQNDQLPSSNSQNDQLPVGLIVQLVGH